eukprot:NODE_479_length_6970_cov_0.750982.p1 type:complete len:562 gc:universal NODE_479_length_6970_cov_0.750982:4869-3184(-)
MSIPRMLLKLLAVFANGRWGPVIAEGTSVYNPTYKALRNIEIKEPLSDDSEMAFYYKFNNGNPGNPIFYNVRDHSTNGKLSEPLIIANELRMAVVSNGLQNFYPDPVALDQLAFHLSEKLKFNEIANLVGRETPLKEAYKLARLALYDIYMVVDDSGSIFNPHFSERKEEVREFSSMLIDIVSKFDTDGLDFYFLNKRCNAENSEYKFQNSGEFRQVFDQLTGRNCYTPTGSTLSDRVIKPLFRNIDKFSKPVLVYLLTDGEPYHRIIGNWQDDTKAAKLLVENAFLDAYTLKKLFGMQQNAIEFVIGQIGNDKAASLWLDMFDEYPIIAPQVDVTDDFKSEGDQVLKRNGRILKKWQWKLKYVLGAIDDARDGLDSYTVTLPDPEDYADLGPDSFNPCAKKEKYDEKIQNLLRSNAQPSCTDRLVNRKKFKDLKILRRRIREFNVLKKYLDYYVDRRSAQMIKNEPSLPNYNLDSDLFNALAAEYGIREEQYLTKKGYHIDSYFPFTQYDMHITSLSVHNYLPKIDESNQQFGSENYPNAPLASENMGHGRPFPTAPKWS